MKIKKVIIENFRAFYGSIEIPMDDLTVFIGKNDQGKSSILEAIDIFINEGKGIVKIEESDLNRKAKEEGEEEFKIGIIFKELPTDLVIDATNRTSLKDEYLLNQDGDLEIWKTFKIGKPPKTFIKCSHPANDDFLKSLMQKKIKELQEFVKHKNIDSSSMDNRKSADLRRMIRNYYEQKDGSLKLQLLDIGINDEGIKDIWNNLRNYLPVYVLFHSDRKNIEQDDEIQDPLKIKIQEIFKRQNIQDKLQEIAEEIDKEIKDIANGIINKFNEISRNNLFINLEPNIPEVESLKWHDVYKSIGFKTDNDVPLNKRGSGIRRLILISSFLAESEKKFSSSSQQAHIIYAIEEPETSLHPDLQKILIDSIITLSENGKHQIFFSTHSPALIRIINTSAIRYIEQLNGEAKVNLFDDHVMDKIVKNLGLLPTVGKVIICVEGKNDEKFLKNINENIDELKNIINLKEKIESGLIAILPMGGSKLGDFINRYVLENTNVIEFHLYDKDEDEKYKNSIENVKNRKDGSYGVLTKKREIENYIPKEIIETEFNIILDNIDVDNWDEEDIPKKVLEKCPDIKETAIKEKLCRSCSQKLTKEHLVKMSAWEEIEGWFKKIKEIFDKAVEIKST